MTLSPRLRNCLPTAIVMLAIVLAGMAVGYARRVDAASPAPPEECVPIGKVGNEVLYFCESDYVDCVWDPSPALGAGVMDCD